MKGNVYTCEICNALFLCLKFFQEHRQKHASQENMVVYTCNYCPTVHNTKHENRLHSESHKNETPHNCDVCRMKPRISEVEHDGNKRSIGTIVNPFGDPVEGEEAEAEAEAEARAEADSEALAVVVEPQQTPEIQPEPDSDGNEHEQEHEEEEEEEEEDEEDEDSDDSDEDENEDEDDNEDEEDEGNEVMADNQHKNLEMCKPNVTNIIYVTNQTINHTTTPQQKSYLKPSRPSRSTGKGKGNRKTRLTSDGDIRRKFSCCHCGKSFKTKSHLQRHILTHTGEKPYHCNRCDCRFNQSSSLRNHVIAIHTKEYPHTCNNCSKGFLMPAVLQKHLQTSECGKSNQVVEGL